MASKNGIKPQKLASEIGVNPQKLAPKNSKLGHKPEELTKRVVEGLEFIRWSDNPIEKTDFWVKCAEWALSISEFPNDLNCGQTCYSEFLKIRLKSLSDEVASKIKELKKLFLSHGARTSKQQAKYNMKKINDVVNPYDYSIVGTW